MNEGRRNRRVLRRATHRSRSVAAAVTLAVLAVAALYAALECTLAALDARPLLVSPAEASAWLAGSPPLALAIAGGAVVLGLVLVVVAIAPGRRGRHAVPHDRLAIVVDDAVIAGSVAGAAGFVTGVAPSRVRADVSSRVARVVVTPTSGLPVDRAAMVGAVESAISGLDPRPRLRARVTIAEAAVGS